MTIPAARSLGTPTCSLKGGREEQEVKVFLIERGSWAGGGRGGAGGYLKSTFFSFPGAQDLCDWALEEGTLAVRESGSLATPRVPCQHLGFLS